jgi:tRNA threonylcarbamoyladenosine biosynthesis protein TsaE
LKTQTRQIVTSSPEETIALGVLLGEGLTEGLIIALDGALGSGKTCLTQGIATGLGVPKDLYVTSPSYTFINEYPGRLCLFHVDLYRAGDPAELEDLGLEEILASKCVTVIEWSEKIGRSLPDERLSVSIAVRTDEARSFQLTARGPQAVDLLERCLDPGRPVKTTNLDEASPWP